MLGVPLYDRTFDCSSSLDSYIGILYEEIIKMATTIAPMEILIIIIYAAILLFVLVMFWRLVRAIERIADRFDQK
jgi:high-affinity Fe2+/Pb2+ permease